MGTRRRRQWSASAAKPSPAEHPVVSIYTGTAVSGDSEPFYYYTEKLGKKWPPPPTLSEAKTDRNNLNTELISLLHIEL